MSISTTPHLNFRGTARAALERYQEVFGGALTLTTYAEVGMPADAPGAGLVVFGQVDTGDGFRVMAYDVPGTGDGVPITAGTTRRENGATLTEQPFFVSVRGSGLAEVQRLFEGLAEGGSVVEPLAASAWSPGFGMLVDPFGVTWVIDVAPAHAA